jgi:hypothetical protein
MTRITGILAPCLFAAGLFAQQNLRPPAIPEFENEEQPGMLRISGIHDTDRVLLDGELIGDGRRIMRFGGKLLVNPGEYIVTILAGDNKKGCSSKILVRENTTSVASCSRPASSHEQDVD